MIKEIKKFWIDMSTNFNWEPTDLFDSISRIIISFVFSLIVIIIVIVVLVYNFISEILLLILNILCILCRVLSTIKIKFIEYMKKIGENIKKIIRKKESKEDDGIIY